LSKARRPLLLVHGAWHGGWCWRKVVDHLAGSGLQVFTPTLTGLGERVHLRDCGVDLELHVADILGVLEYENLEDVVLCGHSYAGMVITAIADRAAHRVGALVYLDAYVPRDGESVLDIRPAAQNQSLLERVESQGDGWLMPPTSAATFGVECAADRDWVDTLCVSMPLRCFTQPIRLAHPTTNRTAPLHPCRTKHQCRVSQSLRNLSP
jgi:pimeloyl-ACP methyl ester carboxylesterase